MSRVTRQDGVTDVAGSAGPAGTVETDPPGAGRTGGVEHRGGERGTASKRPGPYSCQPARAVARRRGENSLLADARGPVQRRLDGHPAMASEGARHHRQDDPAQAGREISGKVRRQVAANPPATSRRAAADDGAAACVWRRGRAHTMCRPSEPPSPLLGRPRAGWPWSIRTAGWKWSSIGVTTPPTDTGCSGHVRRANTSIVARCSRWR